uniref:Argonaute 2 n=1 Tax=Pleurobrachia bachei TaxID=34499 RepID=U3KTQ1_PLEBA|nr:argonaute 2 [Pleurobrachia bachei]
MPVGNFTKPKQNPSEGYFSLGFPLNSKTVARPGYGNKGKDINLFANFYRMKFNPRITVFQYDIEVEPKCPKFMTRRLFHHFAKENKATHFGNGLPVYDGNKNVYSSVELPGVGETPVSIAVTLPDQPDCRGGNFTIKIKFATKIDMSCLEQILRGTGFGDVPQETLVIADIVVRHFPSLRYTVAGRGLFQKPTKDNKQALSPFTEMWSGIYTSARPSNMGLVLNVDESHTAFYSALEKLTKETVSQLSFDVDGQRMSISQYFKKQYNYTLKYPNLPCVWVSPREKKTYLPLEVCHIVEGQRCVRKLNPAETSSMIRATAKKPGVRKQCTDGQLQKMEYNKDPFLKQFGFQVDQSMVQVKGKILQAPKCGYANNSTAQPNAGVWDNRGKQFFKAVHIKNWAILMFPSQNQCQTADVKLIND